MSAREIGLRQELAFWRRFLSTGEHMSHPDWCAVLKPHLPFQYEAHLPPKPNGISRHTLVLDYGSGPVCRLGNVLSDGTGVTLVCADVLSAEYRALRRELGIASRGCFVPIEDLERGPLFDLVVCSNALDHTEDPYETLLKMSRLAEPKGHVLVCGFVNEATHEHGIGLHRFDLSLFSPPQHPGASMRETGQLVIRDYVTKHRKQVSDLDGRKIIFAEQSGRNFKIVWGARE